MARRAAGKSSTESLLVGEMQAAFRELLKQKEDEKREFENWILGNVKNLVLPYLRKLKNSGLTREQEMFVSILESNLSGITSQFARNLLGLQCQLTPTEIRIASLIKDGHTTREIARALETSENTVLFHRFNIRDKLRIKGKSVNLRSYLQTFC